MGRGARRWIRSQQGLQSQVSRRSRLYYYDVLEKRREFEARYALFCCSTVLESYPALTMIFSRARFLSKNGLLFINVRPL